MLMLFWGVMFTIFQDAVLPESKVFKLTTVVIFAYVFGWLVSLIHLPPLLGMLVAGIVLRNVGSFHMSGNYATAVSTLR
jgi:Kef-type K+ transport system membrane component KefB